MKNIVVCSDGTGNTAIKGRGTNVFKLFEAVDISEPPSADSTPAVAQVAFYDDGVGTQSFVPLKLLGGAAGWGLGRNVKELYTAVARVYEPGDKLFLLGFSRGAFTVRTLAGMIARCGIVDVSRLPTHADLTEGVDRIYKAYRARYQTLLSRLLSGERGADQIPDAGVPVVCDPVKLPNGRVEIEFLGVWDTVDAVGLPLHISDIINELFWRFKFPDPSLNPQIRGGCHALSIDEERHSFAPVLWSEKNEKPNRIDQVWFAGVHSNVGGGYPRQGISLVALDWMMCKAELRGLRFLPAVRQLYRELQNVDDKQYDPRTGLRVFYRWKPRDILALCKKNNLHPKVHISVLQRIAHSTEGYAPGNLPPKCTIVDTIGGTTTQVRRDKLQKVLTHSHATRAGRADLPLLDELSGWLKVGFASYYVLLATVVAAVATFCWQLGRAWGADGNWLALIGAAAAPVYQSPWLWGGLFLSYAGAYVTDLYFSRTCSEFWHKAQPELKKALS